MHGIAQVNPAVTIGIAAAEEHSRLVAHGNRHGFPVLAAEAIGDHEVDRVDSRGLKPVEEERARVQAATRSSSPPALPSAPSRQGSRRWRLAWSPSGVDSSRGWS
jgi:hypothetical protein